MSNNIILGWLVALVLVGLPMDAVSLALHMAQTGRCKQCHSPPSTQLPAHRVHTSESNAITHTTHTHTHPFIRHGSLVSQPNVGRDSTAFMLYRKVYLPLVAYQCLERSMQSTAGNLWLSGTLVVLGGEVSLTPLFNIFRPRRFSYKGFLYSNWIAHDSTFETQIMPFFFFFFNLKEVSKVF